MFAGASCIFVTALWLVVRLEELATLYFILTHFYWSDPFLTRCTWSILSWSINKCGSYMGQSGNQRSNRCPYRKLTFVHDFILCLLLRLFCKPKNAPHFLDTFKIYFLKSPNMLVALFRNFWWFIIKLYKISKE